MTAKVHECCQIPGDNVSVVSADQYLNEGRWQWCLVVRREATESDLNDNQYLESVGDTIWHTSVGISHCPFCGECLPGVQVRSQGAEAEFLHVDFSAWSSTTR